MDDRQLKEIVDATDGLLKEYMGNPHLVIPDVSTGLRRQFDSVEALARARKAQRQCMWPGCIETAIRGSHTIPRSAALRRVARSGHLITPILSQTTGRIVVRRIGTNEASVVPGFCKTHEAEFFEFESKGQIDTERALARQLFRSICREVVRLDIGVTHGERMLSEYREFCRSQIERLLRERSGNETVSVSGLSENALWTDANEKVAGARKTLEFFRSTLYRQAAAGLDNPDDAGLDVIALQLDIVIPVCLSGTGSFQVVQGSTTDHVQAVLAVIPGKASTLVAIAVAGEQKEHLALYKRLMMSGGFQVINMIESWMIHGTDHWFLDPVVWHEIQPPIREQILDDIMDDRPGIGTPYGRTIFNRLKRESMLLLEGDENVSAEERERIRASIPSFTDRQHV
jgi:hypothetical protein